MASTSKIPDDEDIDYSDLEAKYKVPYEEGFDNVLVVDNVPVVDANMKDRLLAVITRKFAQTAAPIVPGTIHFPWDDKIGKSKG